jgi:hypothetical protein
MVIGVKNLVVSRQVVNLMPTTKMNHSIQLNKPPTYSLYNLLFLIRRFPLHYLDEKYGEI